MLGGSQLSGPAAGGAVGPSDAWFICSYSDHKSPGNKTATDTPNSASRDMGWTGPRSLDLSDGLGGLLRVTAPCGLQRPQQLVPSCVSVRVCAHMRAHVHARVSRAVSIIDRTFRIAF